MNADIERLLGGYATNTLTEEERRALFDAALNDQEVFDALGREQPLRDLFDDPASRREAIEALQPRRRALFGWLGAAAAVCAAAVVAVVVWTGRGSIDEAQKQLATPQPVESRQPAESITGAPAAPLAKKARRAKRVAPFAVPLATNRAELELRATRGAAESEPGIRYTLQRDANGRYSGIVFTAAHSGHLEVSAPSGPLISTSVNAGIPATVPVPPETDRLRVVYVPQEDVTIRKETARMADAASVGKTAAPGRITFEIPLSSK